MKCLLLIISVIVISLSVVHAQGNKRLKGKSHPSTTRKDSLKYFPKLLGDSMSINFDPNKYLPRNTQVTDTTLAPKKDATSTNIAKQTTSINTSPQKNTVPATTITTNKTTVNTPGTTSAAPKDTTAAWPFPVKDTIPAAITQRSTSLINTYQVSSPHITVQLYDNGQTDGDAVSVYYNGRIIISNQTLTHKAITFTMEASSVSRHHEFILISESEGFEPPNTALMRIKAGSQQFELNVSSSNARNAKIAIEYIGE